MNDQRVWSVSRLRWSVLALAMAASATLACGNYVNDNTGDEYGIEVAEQSLVIEMSYTNDATGTEFRWTSDGSTSFRLQVPNVLVTTFMSGASLGCASFGQTCTSPLQPIPWTSTNKWYVQGSIDAPKWAASSYAPTNSLYQPTPASSLATAQIGSQLTFSWARSQFAASYRLQVPPFHIGSYTPVQADCDNVALPTCRVTLTMPYAVDSSPWYVQTNGTGPLGPWVASTFSVAPTPDTLPKPTSLFYSAGETGVTFSWDRVNLATHYRLQVPNHFTTLYTAAEVNCGGGETQCWIEAQLPASSGTWYVQAKYIGTSEVSSAWAGLAYTIDPDGCAVAPPLDLQATGDATSMEFSWTKSELVTEYKLQVVNNFLTTYQASDIGCGDGQGTTCTVTHSVSAGTQNWYVQSHGICLWSLWSPAATYTTAP